MFNMIVLQAGGAGMNNLIFIPLMLIVVYMFMIRPQIKRQKKEKSFQATIKKGAKVVTTSGIHGKIVDISDTTCVIETGAGKIKFERSAISLDLTTKYAKTSVSKK